MTWRHSGSTVTYTYLIPMSFPLILLFSDAPLNLSMKPTSLWGRPSPVPYEQAAHKQLASRDLDFLVNKHNLKCLDRLLQSRCRHMSFPRTTSPRSPARPTAFLARSLYSDQKSCIWPPADQLKSWQLIVGWSAGQVQADAQAASWSQCSIFTLSPTLLPLLKKLPPSFLTWQVEAASMAQELVLVLVLYYLYTVVRHMYKC